MGTGSHHVHTQDSFPIILGRFFGSPVMKGCGVVDQNVEAVPQLIGPGRHLLRVLFRGHIASEGLGHATQSLDLSRHTLRPLSDEICNQNPSAFPGKQSCRRMADP